MPAMAAHVPDAAVPARLREQQWSLTRHLRDPEGEPAPEGIEPRRLQVYRELLFNNIEGLLAGNFPVIRRLLADEWPARVRGFYRDHRCQTPLFPEIAREFLRYLEARPDPGRPWLTELAHYEWVELALQISEQREQDVEADPHGDLLDGTPLLSPLAWPLAYQWPVHRIGPDWQPTPAARTPILLLLRRQDDGTVHFSELSPLAYRLLELLGPPGAPSGGQCLQQLALEAGVACDDAFLQQGRLLLEQMRERRVLLGTAP